MVSLPAWVAGRVVPTNRPVLPIALNVSATATGASDTPLMVRFTVAVDCAPAASAIVYVNESFAVWPVDRPWNADSGLYVYEPFALIVTDAPLASTCVNAAVPLSRTTVFVSPGPSTSVSLASTPGAATFNVVSSLVVPVLLTAVGGSLTARDVDRARRDVAGGRNVVGGPEGDRARRR